MKTFVAALLIPIGVGAIAVPHASAAPASPAAIGNAAVSLDGVQQVWWDRWGRWHPNRRYYGPPAYVAPRCRSVRVCGPRGCWWQRRCY
jgi:hypothetical protein